MISREHSDPPGKRDRQQRAEQMRKDRERQEMRRRNIITVAIVVVVIAVIAVAGIAVKSAMDDTAEAPARTPEGLTDTNGVLYAASDAGGTTAADPVRLTIFEDFGCPVCQVFEAEVGPWLDDQVASGAIEIEFRPVAFLPGDYSYDALGASMCVYEDGGAQAYRDYARLLFEHQPSEGSAYDDGLLTELADEVGGAVGCVDARPFRGWVGEQEEYGVATREAFADADSQGTQVGGTPTVWVDGVEVARTGGGYPGVDDLESAIAAARTS